MKMTFGLNSRKKRVQSLSPILFDAGLPNVVCGYTLGLQSVAYCLRVIVTLTSGLPSRKILSLGHLSHCYSFLVFELKSNC